MYSPRRNVSGLVLRGKRTTQRGQTPKGSDPKLRRGDAIAVARWRGDDEELRVSVALVDGLMRSTGHDLDAGPGREAVAGTVDLHREHTGEHVEELPCIRVAMTRLA